MHPLKSNEENLLKALAAVTDEHTAEHVRNLGRLTHIETDGDSTYVRYVTEPGTSHAEVYRLHIWKLQDRNLFRISSAQRL